MNKQNKIKIEKEKQKTKETFFIVFGKYRQEKFEEHIIPNIYWGTK